MQSSAIPAIEADLLSRCRAVSSFQECIGVWKRTELYEPLEILVDSSTTVIWCQTPISYADIRIPNNRPSFLGVNSLEECSEEQMNWMCRQKSFAGVMKFHPLARADADNHVVQSGCAWHRHIDLQPNTGAPDEGFAYLLNEDPNTMYEYGTSWDYKETWIRQTATHDSEDCMYSLRMSHFSFDRAEEQSHELAGYLTIVGDHFVYSVDRVQPLPHLEQSSSLSALVQQLQPNRFAFTSDELAHWLGFEASYGRVEKSEASDDGIKRVYLRVANSTLPWLEGTSFCIEIDSKSSLAFHRNASEPMSGQQVHRRFIVEQF